MAKPKKRILSDGTVVWDVRYRAPDGRRPCKTFRTKVEAERWFAATQTDAARGEYVDPKDGRIRFGPYAEVWFRTKSAKWKPSTQNFYRSLLRSRVLPRWEHEPLTAIQYEPVALWIAQMVEDGEIGPSRIRHCLIAVSGVLSLAVKFKKLRVNPVKGFDELPALPLAEKRYLTHAQVADLAEACGDDGVGIYVLAYCGIRFGELAGLRVRDVNTMRRRLSIVQNASEVAGRLEIGTPKPHRLRTVPVPRFLCDMLDEQLAGRGADDPAFPAPQGGWLREGGFRRRSFDRAVAAVGLDGLTPHDLRHTAASLAVSVTPRGSAVQLVQRMLGHKSATVTMDVYADLFDDDLDLVADSLDASRAAALTVPHTPVVSVLPVGRRESRGR